MSRYVNLGEFGILENVASQLAVGAHATQSDFDAANALLSRLQTDRERFRTYVENVERELADLEVQSQQLDALVREYAAVFVEVDELGHALLDRIRAAPRVNSVNPQDGPSDSAPPRTNPQDGPRSEPNNSPPDQSASSGAPSPGPPH